MAFSENLDLDFRSRSKALFGRNPTNRRVEKGRGDDRHIAKLVMNSIRSVNSNTLPSPKDLPQADVVIYDGLCQFCTKQVKNLHRWDGKNRLAFISLHDPEISRWAPDLTHDQLMQQMYVVRPGGQRWGGAAAFRYLTRRLPKLWLLAPLMHIPGTLPLWQWGYDLIARQRYRWNREKDQDCESGQCEIHFKSKSKPH